VLEHYRAGTPPGGSRRTYCPGTSTPPSRKARAVLPGNSHEVGHRLDLRSADVWDLSRGVRERQFEQASIDALRQKPLLRSPCEEGGFLGRASHFPLSPHNARQTNHHRITRLRSVAKSGRACSLALLRRNVRKCGSPPTLGPKERLPKVGALAARAENSALAS
jgi:hypothetical protein